MTLNEITTALFWIVTASYVGYLGWSLYNVARRSMSPTHESARSDRV